MYIIFMYDFMILMCMNKRIIIVDEWFKIIKIIES